MSLNRIALRCARAGFRLVMAQSLVLTAIAAIFILALPRAAHAQIFSIAGNAANGGAPITYQPTNMEGATITVPGGGCTGCVIANAPSIIAGTYNFSLSAFGMIPITFLPNTSPLPAAVYSQEFEGDCFPISISGTLGNLIGSACVNFTIFAQPGSNRAVFQFQFGPAAGSSLVALTDPAYLIIFGTTTSPITTFTTPLCSGVSPPPGCAPFSYDITTTFNAITLDWYGVLSSTPYSPPAAGSTTVSVFNVAGFSQTQATSVLSGQGLTTTVAFQSSSTVPQGTVISQSPGANSSVQNGSTVTIYVSSGPALISDEIPNISLLTGVNTNPLDPSLYVAVSKGNYTQGGPFNDVVVYSTANDTVVANIPLTATSNTPSYLVVDSVNNVIYVSGTNGSNVGTVTVIDGLTHTINAVLTVGRSPAGIAVDPSLNLAYVSNSDDTFISVIQGPTRTNSGAITAPAKVSASIGGGILPLGAIAVDANNNIAVDPYSHTVYAIIDGPAPLGELNYTLAVITGSVAGGYSVKQVSYLNDAGSTDIGANALAVDQKSGRVVIADTEDQGVHIYNPNGGGFQNYFESFYPDSVAIDSTHELAYVSSGYGNVVQINLVTGAETTVSGASAIPCGYAGTAVAVDPGSNEAYFTSCDGTAGLGVNGASLNIWDGAGNALNASLALGSPLGNYGSVSGDFAVTVNPNSHVAYVSSSATTIPATVNTPAITGAIDVINGPAPGTSPQFAVSVFGTSSSVATQALDAPLTVSFGNVPDSTPSSPETFVITNLSTTTAAVQATILGSAFAFATEGDGCVLTLQIPSGGTCGAELVFDPTTSVAYNGGVAFLDNERDTPQLMGLSGTGTGTYPLIINPSTIPVGYVGLPYTPTAYPLYFTSPNAINGGSFNICAVVGGQPSTNPADCCPQQSDYGLPSGSCPAGLLPAGMNWAYGNLSAPSGSITTTGSYQFAVVATDTNGDSGSAIYTLVIDPAFTTTLGLSSNSVIESQSVTATVTLNQPAPAGGALVFIDSDNTSVVPSTLVEIPAGATSAMTTVETKGVTSVTPVGLYTYYGTAGSTVTLIVNPSGGGAAPPPPPPTTTVPKVVGDTQAAATTAITGAGLTVGTVTTASSSTVALGLVISQGTAPGTVEADGLALNFVVSSGLATTTVPKVVGDTQAAATTAITGAGLIVGTVTMASSSTVASGVVISQSPASGGAAVADGSSVNLTVSSGPPTTTVPNVVGDTQAAATTAITGAGLTVGTVTMASSSTVASGVVISQSPAFGGPAVADGSSVNLTVSSGPPTATVPKVVGDTQAAATTAITGAGLIVGTVTMASSSTVASGLVISQSPLAGISESDGIAVNLVVSSGPAAAPTIVLALDGTPVVTSTPSGWSVSVTLQNTGNVTAQTVQETAATLNGVAQLAAPASISIAADATGSIVLTFPATAGTAGTSVHFAVSGTYSATALSGSWGASLRAVALP